MIVLSIILALTILGIGIYSTIECETKGKVISGFITGTLLVLIISTTIWYYNGTESGKREIKDYKSNIKGGISRVVTVYDINGKEIKKYEGQFDVSYDSNRIKFDDEQGKRHIIYYTTGTVTIDEI